VTPDTATNTGAILTLANFTCEALIIPELKSRDMAGTIQELSRAFQNHDLIWDAQKLHQIALEREQQMSTAMGFGVAFPHVRSDACPQLRFALGCSSAPFRWGKPGSLNVQFVFLNAIPANEPSGYLKLLSGMSKFGKENALLEQLRDCETAKQILEILGKVQLRK